MLFSGIPFLFYFLPIVLTLYFILPWKLKNASMVFSSLIFYAWGEPKYVFLMLATITLGYLFGLWIEKLQQAGKNAAPVFVLSVAAVLASLMYFKYAGFLVKSLNTAAHLGLKVPKIALPIGISFYSFQLISYLVDVFRGREKAQRNFIDLAAYITFFPQLIAGPIVRYGDIVAQLKGRSHTLSKTAKGIRRFVLGLSKKILIANMLAELCTVYYGTTNYSVAFAWLYALAYSLQIYFDFSGYSDMAIGLGAIFGFEFPENFRYPFISDTITEFWRRWHMTLGSWFRDYVYIPLGGNRVVLWKQIRNILIVWALTGLWHGADWTFVCWGLYYGLWLLLEKFVLGRYLKKNRPIRHIYTILLTLVGFVILDASTISAAGTTIAAMFGLGGHPLTSPEFFYYLRSFRMILLIGIVGSTPLPKLICSKISENTAGAKVLAYLEPVVLVGLLVLCTANLVDGSYNPFLYFRF